MKVQNQSNSNIQSSTPKVEKKTNNRGRCFCIPKPSKLLVKILKVALCIFVAAALINGADAAGEKYAAGSQPISLAPSPQCTWRPTPSLPTQLVNGFGATWTTNAELVKRYRRLEPIGAGGGGNVCRVWDKKTNQAMAMKLSHGLIGQHYMSESIPYLLDTGITPHLTRTYNAYASKMAVPIVAAEPPNFFVDAPPNASRKGSMQVLTMELMTGNLQKDESYFSEKELLTFEIQRTHATRRLKSLGLVLSDSEKDRNVFYKPLDRTDCFQGYSMKDFDYWKYNIDGYDIYVPRPDYLLKLGDFDIWQFPKPFNISDSPTKSSSPKIALEIFLDWFQESFRSLLRRWIEKPINGTVLDMNSIS